MFRGNSPRENVDFGMKEIEAEACSEKENGCRRAQLVMLFTQSDRAAKNRSRCLRGHWQVALTSITAAPPSGVGLKYVG